MKCVRVMLRNPAEEADCPASILQVRPGQKRNDIVRRALQDDPNFDMANVLPISFAAERRFPVMIVLDEAGLVDSVLFGSGTPQSVELDGLKIGLSADEIAATRPEISYIRPSNWGSEIWRSDSLRAPYYAQADVKGGVIARISFLSQSCLQRVSVVEAKEDERRRIYTAELTDKNRWKTISDPEEMLDAWVEVTNYWGIKDDRFKWLAGRLRSANPDEWHAFATQWNWDNGLAPLIWIAKRPECDRATAAHIYWGLGPEYFAKYGCEEPDPGYWDDLSYSTIQDIVERWERGFYRRSELRWRKPDYVDKLDFQKLRTPVGLRQTIEGRTLGSNVFWSSVPSEFHFE